MKWFGERRSANLFYLSSRRQVHGESERSVPAPSLTYRNGIFQTKKSGSSGQERKFL